MKEKEINMESEEYYLENEKRRKERLKANMPNLYEKIIKEENIYRKGLIMFLLNYKNKEEQFRLNQNFVSLKNIDVLKEFINLNESKINGLNQDEKEMYKNISIEFIELIPDKVKKEYYQLGRIKAKSNQKYLNFLHLNQLLS